MQHFNGIRPGECKSMKLIITRPQIDAIGLAEKLRALGHEVLSAPLLDIIARQDVLIADLPYQGICATSANGLRCLSSAMNVHIPVFTVGEQSAAAARAKGFQNVTAEGGDVDGLVHYLSNRLKSRDKPVLYLSGAETSGDLEGQLAKYGYNVQRVITYDAVPCALDSQIDDIATCDGVLLYSRRTAKLWSDELQRLKRKAIAMNLLHFCLSPQVAQALPQNWPRSVARMPTEKSLLALLDLASEAE